MSLTGTLTVLILILGALQAILMLFDELHYHRLRGLGPFERWGHVLDTCLFLLALLIPAFCPPTQTFLIAYTVMASLSTLVITKDEAIHSLACSAGELWCHSMLFILHGALLLLIGILWHLQATALPLKALPLLVGAWGIYQHFYWNIYGRDKRWPIAGHQQ